MMHPLQEQTLVTWIDIDGVHNVAVLEKFGFGLHRLVTEDILNTDQRPKTEDCGEYLCTALKMLSIGKSEKIVTEQIGIISGSNFVLSFCT